MGFYFVLWSSGYIIGQDLAKHPFIVSGLIGFPPVCMNSLFSCPMVKKWL
jgi:hypothetical protein